MACRFTDTRWRARTSWSAPWPTSSDMTSGFRTCTTRTARPTGRASGTSCPRARGTAIPGLEPGPHERVVVDVARMGDADRRDDIAGRHLDRCGRDLWQGVPPEQPGE